MTSNFELFARLERKLNKIGTEISRLRLWHRVSVITAALAWVCAASTLYAIDEDELLPVEEAFIPELAVEGDQVNVKFKIVPGYYLYQERISVKAVNPEAVVLADMVWPKGEPKVDEFFGEMHVTSKVSQ